ncbi:hypothetical protein J2Z32_003345 [Paenibacillus turicensis]|uniref:Uncharacterized protein n=1 Tax=Paenibacillus turicensis TaxID=160487 RepID=A0ABS4FVS7_9BACL|nr:hypothetical protein [Paenibacillus turicensis]MBP1906681.1 hypothetical protein [Paenibacillus turicensis]
MNIFKSKDKQHLYSPVPNKQALIWVAEYDDDTFLAEYDFYSQKKNDFYSIDKDKLLRFGFIGNGSKAYFNVSDGTFIIDDNKIQISYIHNENEVFLTGRTFIYNDIIQFKSAIADIDVMSLKSNENIIGDVSCHSIGYKKQLDLFDSSIHFKSILHIPSIGNQSPYLEIKISSSIDVNGDLLIRVNNSEVDKIDAPLKANMAGIVNWRLH